MQLANIYAENTEGGISGIYYAISVIFEVQIGEIFYRILEIRLF